MNSDKKGENEEIENKDIENLDCEIKSILQYDENMPDIWKKPNVDKDDDNNDLYICWREFKIKPSKVSIFSEFNSDLLWSIISENFNIKDKSINKISEILPDGDGFIHNTKYLIRINKDIYFSFLEFDKMPSKGDSFCSNLIFYYNQINLSVNDLNDLLMLFQSAIEDMEVDVDNKKVYSVTLNQANQLELTHVNFDIKEWDDSDLDRYYSNKTIKRVRKMVKKINKKDKGLHILCGERGCGKTTLLNISMSKMNKRIIYIPLTMIENTLNNIDFASFLSVNKDSVIIIDDCENYFNKIHQKSNIYVSNILQLLDSMNAENLNVHIILSMNMSQENIDENLQNSNNFRSLIEFNPLSNKKAEKLSKKLGFNKKYRNSTKLSVVMRDKKCDKGRKFL